MRCDNCGRDGARIRHTTRSYGKGETLLDIENVPVVVCPRCGESYLTAETLHEVESRRLSHRALARLSERNAGFSDEEVAADVAAARDELPM
jgi:YgiT-type zinc finger domain-containing protein